MKIRPEKNSEFKFIQIHYFHYCLSSAHYCEVHFHSHNYSLYLIQNVVKLLGISCGISGGAGSPDWKKCDVIAKLIANCPSQAESVEEYYKLVSPQVSGV